MIRRLTVYLALAGALSFMLLTTRVVYGQTSLTMTPGDEKEVCTG